MISKFKNIFLRVNIIVVILLFTSQGLFAQMEQDIVSYKSLLSIDKYPQEIQYTIKELELNWYCISDRIELLRKLDSLKTSDPKLGVYITFAKIHHYYILNEFDIALKIIYDNENNNDFPDKGRLHYFKGQIYMRLGKYNDAMSEYIKAERSFLKEDSIALLYVNQGFVALFGEVGNDELVKNYYVDAITLCQKLNYDKGLIIVYWVFGGYYANKDFTLAYELLQKGWDLAKVSDRSIKIKYAVVFLKFLITNNEFEKFEKIYYEIQSDCKETCYLGECSIINTLYAHYKSINGNIDSSIYYNQIALSQRSQFGNFSLIGYSYLNLSSNYLKSNDYKESKIQLDSAKKYLYNNGTTLNKRYYLNYLLDYYKTINTKDSIIEVYSQLSDLNTDFYADQQKQFIAKIEAETEVQRILEKQKYEAELKFQEYRFWYVSVITLLLLILIGAILFQLIRKMQKYNKLKMLNFNVSRKLNAYEKEILQLKRIFQNAITGFFILDKNGDIKYVNESGEHLFSTSENDIIGHPMKDLLLSHNKNDFEVVFTEILKDWKNKEIQLKIQDKSYESWYNFSLSPLFINNELESVLVIVLDVSSSVKSLELEKQQRTILQTLFNSITESIVLLNEKGKIISINHEGAKRLGQSIDDLIGENYFHFLPESLRSTRLDQINHAIEKKEANVYSENIESYNTLVSIYPNVNQLGEVDYLAEFTQDTTDRKLAYEQINSLRQKILRSQMNPHFIFNSLNAIQSYVLKNDIEHAVKYLNSFARLIRMILDSSRFDYINLKKEIEILKYYLELQQLRFGDKFSWTLDVDSNIDTESILLPAMFAQPFIENAIEHGLQQLDSKGIVKISFIRAKDSIVFKVSDNGIGREASKKLQNKSVHDSESLSTKIFNERLYTLNKFSGQKITHDIVDLKDDDGNARGTLVIINIPIIYRSHII